MARTPVRFDSSLSGDQLVGELNKAFRNLADWQNRVEELLIKIANETGVPWRPFLP